ncbi:lipoate--protein ligase [Mesomycoplasma neurolyticum]|uniref:lipoate--protein ligase n=1 Tax=Mesomycoplasma neurolyticum TaxID=2120 RepID=A0A449A5K0_9BACT|nr:lipoate--protein ligase [Mesomycoplasma neurolyticum]VEU59516.1 Lipoate-protein ligase A [Mesomycoplasma neurolyticum]
MIIVEPIRNNKYISDGAYHMAMQVWFFQNYNKLNLNNKTLIFPYISDPHVQIGYFQNPLMEINKNFLNKIQVVRRNTGGGAIYLDSNIVAFCFVKKIEEKITYKDFYEKPITVLKKMGLSNVEFSGKNDLTLDNKKISGAAFLMDNNIFYGGFSLIYDIDYEMMQNILQINLNKFKAKGISSIRQRVTSFKNHLLKEYQNLTTHEFKNEFLNLFLSISETKNVEKFIITEEIWKEIDYLVETKYKNWDWTYGLSPRYSYNKEKRFEAGTLNVSLDIENGKINQIKISGDFFLKPQKQIEALEKALLKIPLKKEELIKALKIIDFENYFLKPIKIDEFIDLILN